MQEIIKAAKNTALATSNNMLKPPYPIFPILPLAIPRPTKHTPKAKGIGVELKP